jgi:carbonic anhydrase
MSHEGCGAVTATLEALGGAARGAKYVEAPAQRIVPGLQGLDPALRGDARLSAAVEANARWSAGQLACLKGARRWRTGSSPWPGRSTS